MGRACGPLRRQGHLAKARAPAKVASIVENFGDTVRPVL
jgi:hypothetical protein